jgi:hypothetical protein
MTLAKLSRCGRVSAIAAVFLCAEVFDGFFGVSFRRHRHKNGSPKTIGGQVWDGR